jgi:O-glycosyl hydrolase
LNESDLSNCQEGPCVSAGQYVTVIRSLIAELDALGLSDVRLVGPDTVHASRLYISDVMADSTLAGRVAHVTEHMYGSSWPPENLYPRVTYWLTETADYCTPCDTGGTVPDEWGFARRTTDLILADLAGGYTGILVWEGFDSYYYHHNSWSFWGLLAYDQTTGLYAPRQRFYANAQLNRFIRPGAVQIDTNTSIGSLTVIAFYDPASGKVSIVGHNTGTAAITINGQLQHLPEVISLALYRTNASVNLQRGTDIPVVGGAFSVTIPADTFFSLTN